MKLIRKNNIEIDSLHDNLFDFNYSSKNNKDNNIDFFIKEYTKYLKSAKILLLNKLEFLSDIDLLNNISTFYNIVFDQNDYLEAISKKYNKKYDKIQPLYSDMIYNEKRTEDIFNTTNSYSEQFVKGYYVASDNKINIDEFKNYTKKEILSLANNNQIVKVCDNDINLLDAQEYMSFKPFNYEYLNLPYVKILSKPICNQDFIYYLKVIRNNLVETNVLKDVCSTLKNINNLTDKISDTITNLYGFDKDFNMLYNCINKSKEECSKLLLKKL